MGSQLLALAQAFDRVAAEEENLDLATRKFEDLLNVGSYEVRAALGSLSLLHRHPPSSASRVAWSLSWTCWPADALEKDCSDCEPGQLQLSGGLSALQNCKADCLGAAALCHPRTLSHRSTYAQKQMSALEDFPWLQEMDSKLDQLAAKGQLDSALLLTLAKAHNSIKDTDFTKEEVKEVMAHLYFKVGLVLCLAQSRGVAPSAGWAAAVAQGSPPQGFGSRQLCFCWSPCSRQRAAMGCWRL